jgi:polyhydroxyalkanoate synthesis regulator phasin
MPDFKHPFNRYLAGEIEEDEAKAMMPDFIENLKKAQGEK